ncbi:MAG: hypothetical protein LBC68_08520 [Prevotellaceae bacterium]|jgi:hypothetical protein|nr:hypothetical protein [Prevotellaceae bacterium]
MEIVKNLQKNRKVIFDSGKFDDWCVFVVEADETKNAPLDKTYFNDLYEISSKYPKNKVYNDFVEIYKNTTKDIDAVVLSQIDDIVNTYDPADKTIIEQWFTVIYAGMVAEENKDRAILKKRIKRLGMHQVLILNMPANEAAQFSKGKPWRELDSIMKGFGF